MNDEYRSADEIQTHLEQLKQDQAALEQALKDRRKEEKKALAAEIKVLIEERGHDVLEIADLIRGGQKKRRGQGAPKRTSNYPTYANPDNPEQVYTRGRRPQWFTEKMLAHGFDPENAEDRQTFKEQHLTKISA